MKESPAFAVLTTYDGGNLLTRRRTPRNTAGVYDAVYYSYDGTGNRTALAYPGGDTCAFAYDDAQRMSQLQTPSGNGCYWSYDESSNAVYEQLVHDATPAHDTQRFQSFDEAERVTSIHYAKGDGTALAYFDYEWDVGNRITQIQRADDLTDYTTYYGYDKTDRLTSEVWGAPAGTQIYAFFYDYDPAGNRLKERRESTAGTEVLSAYYAYDKDNSVVKRQEWPSTTTTYYYYDGNGAMTSMVEGGNATAFTYGPNQLVTGVTPPTGNAWAFDYDGQLNRYKIDRGGGDVRTLLWDGLNCLEERDSSGVLLTRYTYGYTPIYGIGSCVEIYRRVGGAYVTNTLLMDHRGTASVLLDGTGAAVAWRHYNAFGEIVVDSGTWPVDLGYQTNWMTVTIGTKLWGLSAARMYDFTTGRFTQRDPLPNLVRASRGQGQIQGVTEKTKFYPSILVNLIRSLWGSINDSEPGRIFALAAVSCSSHLCAKQSSPACDRCL